MINKIYDSFKNYCPYINNWAEYKRASVTIPLIDINNELYVLFEVRSKNLNTNPNEVCFPGGKIDPNESPINTAIRETCEELGVSSEDFNIISSLNLFVSPFNIIIHPFVIEITDFNKINFNKDEVDDIFLVPLSFLKNANPDSYTNIVNMTLAEDFPYDNIPNKNNYHFSQGSYEILFYKYKDYIIWGLTARILHDFILTLNNLI